MFGQNYAEGEIIEYDMIKQQTNHNKIIRYK